VEANDAASRLEKVTGRRSQVSIVLAAVAMGVFLAAAGRSAAAASGWQTVPGVGPDKIPVWAAGRLWFFDNGTADATRFVVRSAHVSGARLGPVVTTRIATQGLTFATVLGDDAAVWSGNELRAIRLRPDGKLGPLAEVGGGPAPASSSGALVARLPDRAVTVVNANPDKTHDFPAYWAGACCDTNGKVADYHSFVKPNTRPQAFLGVDRHGRLWLSWLGTQKDLRAGIVELDPSTLQPRGKPSVMPTAARYLRLVDVTCGETCRVVVQAGFGSGRGATFWSYSWAAGDRTPTRIPAGGRNGVLAARDYNGRLTVAYYGTGGRNGATPISVARGDARGAHLRKVRTLLAPPYIGSFSNGATLSGTVRAVFGAGGLAVLAPYERVGRGSGIVMRVAIVPP
jgi:hypothetical protein